MIVYDGIRWHLKRFHQRGKRDCAMLKSILTKEPLRWFLLLWIAMAVVRVLLDSNKPGHSTLQSRPGGPPTLSPPLIDPPPPLSWILIFLLLGTLFSLLLWRGL